jgi:hypothetical protein
MIYTSKKGQIGIEQAALYRIGWLDTEEDKRQEVICIDVEQQKWIPIDQYRVEKARKKKANIAFYSSNPSALEQKKKEKRRRRSDHDILTFPRGVYQSVGGCA